MLRKMIGLLCCVITFLSVSIFCDETDGTKNRREMVFTGPLSGTGTFAACDIAAGTLVFVDDIKAGVRHINHSSNPNIVPRDGIDKGGFTLYKWYAKHDIKYCDEILIDYDQFDETGHVKDDYTNKE